MTKRWAMLGGALVICGTALAQEPGTPPAPATQPAAAISATDGAAVTASKGKEVTVEGTVTKAEWSSSGKVMRASFSDEKDGLVVVVFSAGREAIDKAFDGDVAKAMTGAKVRVTGKVDEYRGRPEIKLAKPEQLKILQPAPATQKAQ